MTCASQTAQPAALATWQEYKPAALSLSLSRTSRVHEDSLVRTLYLYDAQIGLPSLAQLTCTRWLPVNVHIRPSGSPRLYDVSSSFFTKQTGSERGNKCVSRVALSASKLKVRSQLPSVTLAWQLALLLVLDISQEYLPAASSLSLLRTSKLQEVSVVLMLYL